MRKAPFPLRSGLSAPPRAVTAKSFIDQHLLSVPFLLSSTPRIGTIAVLGAARHLPSPRIASAPQRPSPAPLPPVLSGLAARPDPLSPRIAPDSGPTRSAPPQLLPHTAACVARPGPARPLSPLTARTAGPAQRAAARHVAPEVMLPNHAHRAALLAPQLQHFLRAEHSDGGNERRAAKRSGRRFRAAARGAVQ